VAEIEAEKPAEQGAYEDEIVGATIVTFARSGRSANEPNFDVALIDGRGPLARPARLARKERGQLPTLRRSTAEIQVSSGAYSRCQQEGCSSEQKNAVVVHSESAAHASS